MGVNVIMLEWLRRLERKGIFRQAELLELGPQDMFIARPALRKCLGDLFTEQNEKLSKVLLEGCEEEGVRTEAELQSHSSNDKVKAIYQLLGVQEYRSLDAYDTRADYKQDLNFEFNLGKKFDVITDFGTSEHCFNTQNVFKMIHRHLKGKGLMLLVLPAFADIDHGFWNLHPTVFKNLARANHYDIVDFLYIDDVVTRCDAYEEEGGTRIDFNSLPINPNEPIDRADIQMLYLDNIKKRSKRNENREYSSTANRGGADKYSRIAVFDHCYVALRKDGNDNSFKFAYQDEYDLSPYLNALKKIPAEITEIYIAPAGSMARALLQEKVFAERFDRIVLVDNYKEGTSIDGNKVVPEEDIHGIKIKSALIVHSKDSLVRRFSESFQKCGVTVYN